MKNLSSNTIAAISTPLSSGAISIVRLSGPEAIAIADKVFISTKKQKPSSFTSRLLTLGTFDAKVFKEQAMCVVFRNPNSYTGEDLVEFQCHGGVVITKGILSALLQNGARLASAGEFTKRAFINGKMDLSDAEGMMDMINAESQAEVRAGYNLLSGKLSQTAHEGQSELIDILSEIEVSFDYPEETILYITKSKAKERLIALQQKLQTILDTTTAGQMIKNGVKVAIIGKPNVGKSSLLNALVMDQKAIVTDVAGTTRDVIEASFSINGLKFNLFDTAGIRETQDKVEKIGVDKAKNIVNSADIILFVKDSIEETSEDKEVKKLLKDHKHLVLINKSDKRTNNVEQPNTLHISALTNQGIETLKQKLYNLASENKSMSDGLILANERHVDAVSRANSHLKQAIESIDDYTLDLVTIDLNLCYSALGEITGNTTSEEIIDAIFSKFCLGK